MKLRSSLSGIDEILCFQSIPRRFPDPFTFCVLLITLLIPGCTLTQEQLGQYSFEHSHALSRVGYSGSLSNTDGSGSILQFDEVDLDVPEFNYRPGLSLKRGPLEWRLEQTHGQAESEAPFSASSGGLTLPAGNYSFDTSVTSTRLSQDWTLDLVEQIQSPRVHWLTGIDFVDYKLTAQSRDISSARLELEDLVHVPFTGFLLDWRLNSDWNLKGIFTKSWLSKASGQPSEYRDTGVSLEWTPSNDWRTHLSLTHKQLGFDHRAGGELLNLNLEIQLIEWGVTFSF